MVEIRQEVIDELLGEYKDRKEVAGDLKPIYKAPTEEQASIALEEFEQKWDKRYPIIGKMWYNHWDRFIPYFAFPEEIRKTIYTTNSIEAVNRQLRKIIKTRGSFPTEDAALKLLWLALSKAEKKWTRPIAEWQKALQQFAIYFPDTVRIPA